MKNIPKSEILNRFTNEHGWMNYGEFNDWMLSQGYEITELERHSRTDGEVHFRYTKSALSHSFDFNGNYWDGKSFGAIIDWLNALLK